LLSNDENHGTVQPIRFRYGSILASGARDTSAKDVPRVQVGEMADLVDEHRAPVAAGVLVRSEHEVVNEQLPAPSNRSSNVALPSGPSKA
jgi:hypothetical protein